MHPCNLTNHLSLYRFQSRRDSKATMFILAKSRHVII